MQSKPQVTKEERKAWKAVKQAAGFMLLFCAAIALQILFLYGAARIPQEQLRARFTESATFMNENKLFPKLLKGTDATMRDYYADSIWLNIAWNLEPQADSVFWTPYYDVEDCNVNENLYESVIAGAKPNQEYMRYWHGTAALLRILHLFWNIRQIYTVMIVVLAALYGLLAFALIKRRNFREAIAVLAGLIAANIWIVPLSVEYVMCFLLVPPACIGALRLAEKEKDAALTGLFVLTGIAANYFDFLTCETVTLLFPLLLVTGVQIRRRGEVKWKRIFTACAAWLLGYGGAWVTKWMLTALISGENVLPYLSGHIQERLSGSPGESTPGNPLLMLGRNLATLFPFGYGAAGRFAAVVLLLAAAYILYVYHKKTVYKKGLWVYAFIGAIPYVRYLFLYEHSYRHYYFTHRAQAASVAALCLIVALITRGEQKATAKERRK